MIFESLVHIGVKRRSGRYPWGSGGELIATVGRLAAKGLSEKEIATGLGMSIQELRNQKALAKAEIKEASIQNVIRQKEGGMSVAAISRETGIAESTIQDLLKPLANIKFQIVKRISNALKTLIKKVGFVDIGEGAEVFIGVSETKLKNAVALLKNEGYVVHYVKQEQLGNPGKFTTIKVLGPPGSTYNEAVANKTRIGIVNGPDFFTTDDGKSFFVADSINNLSSDRILVKYKDDGGGEKDGLIEMRAGVSELNLGGKNYAQVRIGVDGTHYMKGMAIHRDDLPKGIDIVYNTSALSTGNKLDAMKKQDPTSATSKVDSIVKPNSYIDENGKEVFGVVNVVGYKTLSEEGNWATWKKSLASQILSKQAPRLAIKQLDIIYENSLAELSDIKSLTNPTVRSHLLIELADKVDKSAVDLQAAALPRQTTNVLLPDPKMKPTEIYAPNYDNGERVAILRYPHGGVFEIAELTVNNKYSDYRKLIGTAAPDAVAVHPDVAQRLSGADFDGDTVLVVPNKNKMLKTAPSLKELKDFDPRASYPKFDGMKVLSEQAKERAMGDVSNLITDMTIKGASQAEIARAVRHSMVVIDAAKHELNYKQSNIDNGIASLKERYQGSAMKGAATLISRSKSQLRVPQRHDRYSIDPVSGAKVFSYTDEVYIHSKTGKVIAKTTKSTKGAEKDGYDLSSGTVIESVYANHANSMKSLANQARLATLGQKPVRYNPQSRRTYREQVDSLDAKYKQAIRAKPIERKAQVLGGEIYKSKLDANPGMSNKDKQTWKGRSIQLARSRLDSAKPKIDITKKEWEAIEMGAISPTRLKGVLKNADMDRVRSYATPRAVRAGLSGGKKSRALAMVKAGYTASEVASALGVPVTQIRDINKD